MRNIRKILARLSKDPTLDRYTGAKIYFSMTFYIFVEEGFSDVYEIVPE